MTTTSEEREETHGTSLCAVASAGNFTRRARERRRTPTRQAGHRAERERAERGERRGTTATPQQQQRERRVAHTAHRTWLYSSSKFREFDSGGLLNQEKLKI